MSVTDLDQLVEIQLVLQEDATFSNGLWTLDEVIGYFNQRQYRFLAETKMLASLATLPWIPEVEQQALPADWIATIAATWHDYASNEVIPLPRADSFETDRLLGPTRAITSALPQAFREADTTETLTVAVSPPPASPGALGLLYVSLSEILDGTGQLFDVPDDFVPYLKYGVYADMLGKTGRGQDLLRARYAEQRYQEGIILTQSLLQGWP
jgi:hypothetical protein